MKRTFLKTMTSVACLMTGIMAHGAPDEDNQQRQLIVHPQASLTTPYDYTQARTHAYVTFPETYAKLFEGAYGIPGGMDSNLGAVIQKIGPENMRKHNPLLIPYSLELMAYLEKHGGPNKDIVIKQLQGDIENNYVSGSSLYYAMFQGLADPRKISPQTQELADHTRISKDHRAYLHKTPANRYWREDGYSGCESCDEEDNHQIVPSIRHYYAYCKSLYDIERHQNSQVNPMPYYGGKFGLVAAAEAFPRRQSILSLAPASYRAHGNEFDQYSGLVHDLAHLYVQQSLGQGLHNATVGILDQHLFYGGTVESYYRAGVPMALVREQNRFLQMMQRLNEEAFRIWGGTSAYNVFAVGQFMLTHEYPTINEDSILNADFVKIMERIVAAHNEFVKGKDRWESPEDPLTTHPVTGKSLLSDAELIELLFQKNKMAINSNIPETIKTKALCDTISKNRMLLMKLNEESVSSSRELAEKILQINLETLALNESHKNSAGIQEYTEKVRLEREKLAELSPEVVAVKRETAQADLDEAQAKYDAFMKNALNLELVQKAGGFIDLEVTVKSSSHKMTFSETTLKHKVGNYEDTKSLLDVAGVNLPDMAAVLAYKDTEAARESVQILLGLGVQEWTKVMNTYLDQVKYLVQHVQSSETGQTLADEFFQGRYETLKSLKTDLRVGRNTDDVFAYDCRSDSLKQLFAGW